MTDNKSKRQSALIGTYDTHVRAEEVLRSTREIRDVMKKLSVVGKGYHTEGMQSESVELLVCRHQPEVSAYERLLGDALIADTASFARQDGVEAA